MRSRRSKRELYCLTHSLQKISGNGKKYFLHLLSPQQLRRRGFNAKKAKLIIDAYPVFVLSNEWLEELFCPQCGMNQWYHITRLDRNQYALKLATRDLWMQVAHVDAINGNPSVSEFSRRAARRLANRKADGSLYFEP